MSDTDTPAVVESAHALRLSGKLYFDATVREVLAGQALCGLLAAHSDEVRLPKASEAAAWATEFADALIAKLSDRTAG